MNGIMNKLSHNGLSRKISLVCAAISLIALIAYCIYGVVFDYFDAVVCGFLAAAALLSAVHFYSGARLANECNLLASLCVGGAIALFFLNSFPVWADELNNITMYASRGGLAPVIAILVLLFVDVIAGIVSCFVMEKEGK